MSTIEAHIDFNLKNYQDFIKNLQSNYSKFALLFFNNEYNNSMLNRKVIWLLIYSILFTIMLPCGIIMIVLGAQTSKAMLICGIVMCVLGFYGSPILWANFGNLKAKKSLRDKIVLDNTQEIEKLASIYNKEAGVILNEVNDLISKRYLTGYEVIEKKYIVPKQNKTLSKAEILKQTVICQGCGAKVEVVGNEKTNCPYCNHVIN